SPRWLPAWPFAPDWRPLEAPRREWSCGSLQWWASGQRPSLLDLTSRASVCAHPEAALGPGCVETGRDSSTVGYRDGDGCFRIRRLGTSGWAAMHRFIDGEDRMQPALLPHSLEDYVDEENPVRVIEVFIDELDLAALGFS